LEHLLPPPSFTLFAQRPELGSQTTKNPAQSEQTYSLSIAVNEVTLPSHAEDDQGLPVNDSKVDKLSLLYKWTQASPRSEGI
jgi:hypothetical protein